MGKELAILLAGFGGQGILFAGKVIAYAGLVDGREVSWLPSYGPEMRGGTANCSVTIADEPIGSPLIINPTVFAAMNNPSYEKFLPNVVSGGTVVVDSTLITSEKTRGDLDIVKVPATGLADEQGLRGLANMIVLGCLLKKTGFAAYDSVVAGLRKSVPPRKADLIDANLKAIGIGMGYEG